jgi:hypothetical protein
VRTLQVGAAAFVEVAATTVFEFTWVHYAYSCMMHAFTAMTAFGTSESEFNAVPSCVNNTGILQNARLVFVPLTSSEKKNVKKSSF